MAVIEAIDLRRTYQTTTGVIRRRRLDVEAVRPGWMSAVGRCLPLTHGIAAARQVSAGASLGSVSSLVLTELGIGVAYAAAGFVLFRFFEHESRRSAVLDAY